MALQLFFLRPHKLDLKLILTPLIFIKKKHPLKNVTLNVTFNELQTTYNRRVLLIGRIVKQPALIIRKRGWSESYIACRKI